MVENHDFIHRQIYTFERIRVCENQKKWVTKALLNLRSNKKKAFKKAKK